MTRKRSMSGSPKGYDRRRGTRGGGPKKDGPASRVGKRSRSSSAGRRRIARRPSPTYNRSPSPYKRRRRITSASKSSSNDRSSRSSSSSASRSRSSSRSSSSSASSYSSTSPTKSPLRSKNLQTRRRSPIPNRKERLDDRKKIPSKPPVRKNESDSRRKEEPKKSTLYNKRSPPRFNDKRSLTPPQSKSIARKSDKVKSTIVKQDTLPRGPAVVLIGNLTRNVQQEHIEEIFGLYGSISEIELALSPEFNICKGFARVTYEKYSDAKSAREHMDFGQIDGNIISVDIVSTNVQTNDFRTKTKDDHIPIDTKINRNMNDKKQVNNSIRRTSTSASSND